MIKLRLKLLEAHEYLDELFVDGELKYLVRYLTVAPDELEVDELEWVHVIRERIELGKEFLKVLLAPSEYTDLLMYVTYLEDCILIGDDYPQVYILDLHEYSTDEITEEEYSDWLEARFFSNSEDSPFDDDPTDPDTDPPLE